MTSVFKISAKNTRHSIHIFYYYGNLPRFFVYLLTFNFIIRFPAHVTSFRLIHFVTNSSILAQENPGFSENSLFYQASVVSHYIHTMFEEKKKVIRNIGKKYFPSKILCRLFPKTFFSPMYFLFFLLMFITHHSNCSYSFK